MGKHAIQPGGPQAHAIRGERLRLTPGHLLLAIPIMYPAGLARYAASQHDSVGRVALWVLATVAAVVIVASVNAASKTLAARRNRPRSSRQYLLAALACAIVAAVCIGLLAKLANAHSDDGYKYIPLMSVGLESLIAALILAGRSLNHGQVGRHLWLWVHLPAYLTRPD